jgi:PAS domain S-box-containing protein
MKKTLVVDNHPIMRIFMSNLLKKEGHQVLTAEDGISALEILKNYIPDVIFIDLVMPNISGKKLCRIIRNMPKLKDAYIIILSGVAAEEAVNFTQFGANVCIAKGPFNEMSKNVLDALEQSSSNGLREKVIGLEDIYPREMTKELLSIQRHLEAILNNMSEGILELTLEGKIVYANPMATFLIGINEEELLGSNFYDLFDESRQERIRPLLGVIGDTPQAITEDSPMMLNGKQILLKVQLVKYEEHKSIVVILDDVTEKKLMEVRLQYAQRMESIGTLAGGIAHNFNNLLGGIMGNAESGILNIDKPHPSYQNLQNIKNLVQKGSRLTSQLLGYAREGQYEVRPISLNQLVKETSNIFRQTKKEIIIHRELAGDLHGIKADQGQIEQTLMNFYVNAWQAMPGGGDLYIQTENVTLDEGYVKPFEIEPGKYVKISVTDTGVGMDEATRQRIFDPFFTTKEMGLGTGLGLASVYGIIKNHGGFINVYSEKGEGTTFTIYLPASEKEVIKEKKVVSEVVKGEGTVLLVDDEDMIIDVGTQMVESFGYEVLIARSGKEAIEIYKEKREKIDIVILDMIMPVMSGSNTFDGLKEIKSGVKVLLSSGYSIDGQAQEILDRGCNGFIQKPFNMKQLSQKLREILDKE